MPLRVVLMLVATLCLGILLISGIMNVAMMIGIILILAGLEIRHLVSLKNFFLIYTFILFGVAGQYFYPGETDLLWDMVVYLLVFLIGYSLLVLKRRSKIHNSQASVPFHKVARIERVIIFCYSLLVLKRRSKIHNSQVSIPFYKVTRIERVIIFYCVLRLILWSIDVSRYGFANYYSGASLVSTVESYGKEDFILGLLTIVTQFLGALNVSLLVLYVSTCALAGKRIRYSLVISITVVLPLLLLKRSDLVLGFLFLLVIVLWNRRSAFSAKVYTRIVAGLVLVVSAGAGIGLLRDRALTSGSGMSIDSADIIRVISGEFSTVVAYQEIKTNIDDLGYQYGNTILPTLIFKLVPRSWMPDKPTNSSGYFMQKLHPAYAEAGYFMATSIFGDMYLNFGMFGVVVFCFLLGMFSARMDSVLIKHDIRGLPAFLIVYYYYYILLRGDLQSSLTQVILTAVTYLFLRQMVNLRVYLITPVTALGNH